MSESVKVSGKKLEAAKEDRKSQTRTSDYSQPVNSSMPSQVQKKCLECENEVLRQLKKKILSKRDCKKVWC